MTIKKTLGGDRLGSGKKMIQSMHNFERSNHDLGYIWRNTQSPGTLVPFMCEVGLSGDTFDIDLDADVKTHPTLGPLFASFKLQLDVFKCPIRLYQAQLHNNKLNIGLKMDTIKLPQMVLTGKDIDTESKIPIDIQQIHPSSLISYLGVNGIGRYNKKVGTGIKGQIIEKNKNALPLLMYYDIYKNYYANKQEGIGAYINNSGKVQRLGISRIVNVRDLETGDYESGWDIVLQDQEHAVKNSDNRRELDVSLWDRNVKLDETELLISWYEGQAYHQEWMSIYKVASQGETINTWQGEKVTEIRENKEDNNGAGINGTRLYFVLKTPQQLVGEEEYTVSRIRGQVVSEVKPKVDTFPLDNIDNMREDILAAIKQTSPFLIHGETYAPYGQAIYYDMEEDESYMTRTQQGLALKTYQSDIFNNWLSTEWIEGENGISEITAVKVTDGAIKLDALLLANKVYNMLNRIAISGGAYYDWIEAVYGESPYTSEETPVYQGGLSKEIAFQEVISNSEASGSEGTQPLGTLAGRGMLTNKHKGGKLKIKIKEPSYIIGIVSITPRVDYSQGNRWDSRLETMDDFHKPNLDGIGFQDLITEQMAWWSTETDWDTQEETLKSAGKQPAWINYMTNYNRCHGLFADERNEMFMTLNRRYEYDKETGDIADLTTYIDPSKFNYAFAQTDISAQNFWVQLKVDIEARRKISARQIPNL